MKPNTAVLLASADEIAVGPNGGSTCVRSGAVGHRRTFEIAGLGDRFDASVTKAAELTNRIGAAANFETEVAALAERFARGPTRVDENNKALPNTLEAILPDRLNAEAERFADCAATDDFAEGVTALIEKRSLRFSGT